MATRVTSLISAGSAPSQSEDGQYLTHRHGSGKGLFTQEVFTDGQTLVSLMLGEGQLYGSQGRLPHLGVFSFQ